MTWFMVGAAAVTAVSSAASASSASKQVNSQSIEGNEAVIKANIANTIRTGYRVGLANMQRGLKKQQAVQQGYNISRAGGEALGQATANSAASGAVGASIDAVATDIKMKVGEAQAQLQNQSNIDLANFQTQIENIVFEGDSAIESGITSKAQSDDDIFKGAVIAGAVSYASSAMQSKMKLGLGDTGSAGGSTVTQVDYSGFKLGSGLYNIGNSGGFSLGGSNGTT